jgi:hypothetical protein
MSHTPKFVRPARVVRPDQGVLWKPSQGRAPKRQQHEFGCISERAVARTLSCLFPSEDDIAEEGFRKSPTTDLPTGRRDVLRSSL